jgi:hypothetical protein
MARQVRIRAVVRKSKNAERLKGVPDLEVRSVAASHKSRA